MPISHKHKIIFIHIPKNAGTSVLKALDIKEFGHRKWFEYQFDYPNEWETYLKFGIVRNPYDRFVSNYEYAKMDKSYWHDLNDNSISGKHKDYDICSNKSFNGIVKLVENQHKLLRHQGWKNQFSYIYDSNNNLMIDKVLRYENLINDFNELEIGVELSIINKSNRKDNWESYYTNDTKKIIHKHYIKDFKLLNYSMN